MAKNHEINLDNTVTARLWAKSLPELLEDVKNFVEKEGSPRAIWEINFHALDSCDVQGEWQAVLTWLKQRKTT